MNGLAVDVNKNIVLAGSSGRKNHVSLFNIDTGERVYEMTMKSDFSTYMVYSCSYSKLKEKTHFAVVGDDIRLFSNNEHHFSEEVPGVVFCSDWAHSENSVAIGTSEGTVIVYKIIKH